MVCSICLNEIENNDEYKTNCNHTFHKKCIDKWFQKSHRCPLCRNSKFNNISLKEYEKNYWRNSKEIIDIMKHCEQSLFKYNIEDL